MKQIDGIFTFDEEETKGIDRARENSSGSDIIYPDELKELTISHDKSTDKDGKVLGEVVQSLSMSGGHMKLNLHCRGDYKCLMDGLYGSICDEHKTIELGYWRDEYILEWLLKRKKHAEES